MGREVRRVPKNWQHPKDEDGHFIPLYNGEDYEDRVDYSIRYKEKKPKKKNFMPIWSPEEATHFMMYEDVTEGTPLSPAFETPEELARWLTDNRVSYFGDMTATYEEWRYVAKGGWGGVVMVVDK